MLLVEDVKIPTVLVDGLRGTEEKSRARTQCESKNFEHTLLCFTREIDEQIATRHKIQPRKRGIFEQIMNGKKDALTNVSSQPESPVFFDKKAAQPVFGNICGDSRRIKTLARPHNYFFIEVG